MKGVNRISGRFASAQAVSDSITSSTAYSRVLDLAISRLFLSARLWQCWFMDVYLGQPR